MDIMNGQRINRTILIDPNLWLALYRNKIATGKTISEQIETFVRSGLNE